MAVELVADVDERLAGRRSNEMVRALRRALADGEPAALLWTRVAAAVEDAAGCSRSLGGSKKPPTRRGCKRAASLPTDRRRPVEISASGDHA